jgi:hypothetical protein
MARSNGGVNNLVEVVGGGPLGGGGVSPKWGITVLQSMFTVSLWV